MAHQKDLDVQARENANFMQTWGDTETGIVFCLSEAPSKRAGHYPSARRPPHRRGIRDQSHGLAPRALAALRIVATSQLSPIDRLIRMEDAAGEAKHPLEVEVLAAVRDEVERDSED
jgi:hypothetical protein